MKKGQHDKELAIPDCSDPPLIVVRPVKELEHDRINVPAPLLVKATEVAVPLLITPLNAAGLELSLPIDMVLAPAVPEEFVRLPEPVNEPRLRLVLAIFNEPLVMVSNPERVVAALKVTPALLFIVRLAGVFCVSSFPVAWAAPS